MDASQATHGEARQHHDEIGVENRTRPVILMSCMRRIEVMSVGTEGPAGIATRLLKYRKVIMVVPSLPYNEVSDGSAPRASAGTSENSSGSEHTSK